MAAAGDDIAMGAGGGGGGKPQQAGRQLLVDVTGGAVGGAMMVLAGHPMDTIKVSLQTQPSGKGQLYTGFTDCLKKIVAAEGAKGLYRGVSSPLVGLSFLNGTLFLFNGAVKRALLTHQNSGKPVPDKRLTMTNIGYAGMISGLFVATLESPTDNFKSKMQVAGKPGQPVYASTFDCAKQIVSRYGMRGAYQGFGATVIRNVPANGLWFFTYDYTMRAMTPAGKEVEDLAAWYSFTAGGMAGIAYWALTYPADVIKTRMQTDNADKSKRVYRNWLHTARTIHAVEGAGAFFKGFSACMIRAFPANGACFLGVNLVCRFAESAGFIDA